MQADRAASAGHFQDVNLPARNPAMTTLADSNVVERMPEMKFVEMAKRIELVFESQGQWGQSGHEPRMTTWKEARNQEEDCWAYR